MQARARMGRFGLVLALLVMLLGMSAAPAHSTDGGFAGQHPVPVIGESASPVPSPDKGLHDRPRLSEAARHVLATALPETCWAVGPGANRGCSLQRCSAGEVGAGGIAAAASTRQSCRAPPSA